MPNCPECLKVHPAIVPGTTRKRQLYCSPACQQAYGARRKTEGARLIVAAKAAYEMHHAKTPAGRATKVSAQREVWRMLGELVKADRKAGRGSTADLFNAMGLIDQNELGEQRAATIAKRNAAIAARKASASDQEKEAANAKRKATWAAKRAAAKG